MIIHWPDSDAVVGCRCVTYLVETIHTALILKHYSGEITNLDSSKWVINKLVVTSLYLYLDMTVKAID